MVLKIYLNPILKIKWNAFNTAVKERSSLVVERIKNGWYENNRPDWDGWIKQEETSESPNGNE